MRPTGKCLVVGYTSNSTEHGSPRSCVARHSVRVQQMGHNQLACNGAVLHFDSADLILDNDASVDVPEAP